MGFNPQHTQGQRLSGIARQKLQHRAFRQMVKANQENILDAGKAPRKGYWQIERINGSSDVRVLCFLNEFLSMNRVCTNLKLAYQAIATWQEMVKRGEIS